MDKMMLTGDFLFLFFSTVYEDNIMMILSLFFSFVCLLNPLSPLYIYVQK